MKTIVALFLTVFTLTLNAATAKQGALDKTLTAALAKVSVTELPATAAEIVRATDEKERVDVAVEVLRVVNDLRPSAMVAAIGAMSRVAPEASPSLAVEGATLQRKQSRASARAAAAAATDYADEIVGKVCAEFPSLFTEIPVEVARVAPNSDLAILDALGEAIPTLEPFLARARTLVSTRTAATVTPPVALVMVETVSLLETGVGVGGGGVVPDEVGAGGGRKKKSVKKVKKKSKKKKKKKTKKKVKKKKTKKKTKSKDYSKP